MPSDPPVDKHGVTSGSGGLRWSAWNLLLLVPLLMLVTPWFNFDSPRLFGLPFFYWYQFAFVPLGVLCVAVVYVRTKHISGGSGTTSGPGSELSVDDLDEGDGR